MSCTLPIPRVRPAALPFALVAGMRIALHGAVLVVADLAGIAAGAAMAFFLTGTPNQVWLQLPVAVAVTIGCYGGWMLALRRAKISGLLPRSEREMSGYLPSSLVCGVLLFVPVHYVTQGYLTAVGNLIALAGFQLPVNSIALVCAAAWCKSLPRDGSTSQS